MAFGEFGLMALEPGWVDSRQIEASRRAITRYVRRGGKIWIRIFPDKPVTAKPAETRMGSGKGAPDHWVAVIKPGRIMFEIAGIRPEVAAEALRLAGHKLPIRTKFVTREDRVEFDPKHGTRVFAEIDPNAVMAEAMADEAADEAAAGEAHGASEAETSTEKE